MPYTEKQRKFFNAAAHSPDIAAEHGISGREADKLAHEANDLASRGEEKPPVRKSNFIDFASVFGRR